MSEMTRAQFVHTVENARNIAILTPPNASAIDVDTARALTEALTQKEISCALNDLSRLQSFVIDVDLSKTPLNSVTHKSDAKTLRIHLSPKSGLFSKQDIQIGHSEYRFDLLLTVNVENLESLPDFPLYKDFFQTVPHINLPADPEALKSILNT